MTRIREFFGMLTNLTHDLSLIQASRPETRLTLLREFPILSLFREISMLRFFKWVLIIALVLGVAMAFWVIFALWSGIYSVYSYPPSKTHPDGSTLLVTREQGEPTFNSPDYIPPAVKQEEGSSGGVGFGTLPMRKRPVEMRTIVELPFIEWAYHKSLDRAVPD